MISRARPDPDFYGLRERLWSHDREERLEAAAELALHGADAVEPLRGALGNKCAETRRAVLLALEPIGGERAQALLHEALKDPEMSVRQTAAEALGRVGDESAIGPLTDALRACFVRGSARRQLWTGVAVLTGLVLLYLGIFVLPGVLGWGSFGGAAGSWVYPTILYYFVRRKRSSLCRAISEALAAIAQRAPSPQVRAVLPELDVMSADVLQQDRESRRASRAAATHIRELTDNLKSLPIAAEGADPDASTLPRPAGPEPESVRSTDER